MSALESRGSYRILGVLGHGGMGRVYLGRMTGAGGFSRLVAIKQLLPTHAHADEQRLAAMFVDEARVSAQIRHVNVVSTLDILPGTTPTLVQEYIEGDSLAALNKRGPVPVPIAVAIAMDLARGLGAAHEARNDRGEPLRIVHRDVSPHNVLVGIDGVARVTDFGIAKATGRLTATATGEVKGKLAYMSPEQIRGTPLTGQSDLYAVGVVLWEMLTGERLFSAASLGELAERASMRVPPPSTHVAIPRELDAIVLKALATDLGVRHLSASELVAELAELRAATPEVVGDWVRDRAHETLEARRKMASGDGEDFSTASMPDDLAGTERSLGATKTSRALPATSTSRAARIGTMLVVVLAIAAAAVFFRRKGASDAPAPASLPPIAAESSPPPVAPPTAPSAAAPIAMPEPPASSSSPPTRRPKRTKAGPPPVEKTPAEKAPGDDADDPRGHR